MPRDETEPIEPTRTGGRNMEQDQWPKPEFNPGPPKHLHAMGVIALTFAQLERSIEALFFAKAAELGMPNDFTIIYFYSLDDQKRSRAILSLFSEDCEDDENLRVHVDQLIKGLNWARDCRNQILHAEMHPMSFYKNEDLLYLTKRLNKRSAETGFMFFELAQIRGIAERIREYVKRSAELNLFFRNRHVPENQLADVYKPYARLPSESLVIDDPLTLERFPQRWE